MWTCPYGLSGLRPCPIPMESSWSPWRNKFNWNIMLSLKNKNTAVRVEHSTSCARANSRLTARLTGHRLTGAITRIWYVDQSRAIRTKAHTGRSTNHNLNHYHHHHHHHPCPRPRPTPTPTTHAHDHHDHHDDATTTMTTTPQPRPPRRNHHDHHGDADDAAHDVAVLPSVSATSDSVATYHI